MRTEEEVRKQLKGNKFIHLDNYIINLQHIIYFRVISDYDVEKNHNIYINLGSKELLHQIPISENIDSFMELLLNSYGTITKIPDNYMTSDKKWLSQDNKRKQKIEEEKLKVEQRAPFLEAFRESSLKVKRQFFCWFIRQCINHDEAAKYYDELTFNALDSAEKFANNEISQEEVSMVLKEYKGNERCGVENLVTLVLSDFNNNEIISDVESSIVLHKEWKSTSITWAKALHKLKELQDESEK